MKCPPKNTRLLLSEISKDPRIVSYKMGRSLPGYLDLKIPISHPKQAVKLTGTVAKYSS